MSAQRTQQIISVMWPAQYVRRGLRWMLLLVSVALCGAPAALAQGTSQSNDQRDNQGTDAGTIITRDIVVEAGDSLRSIARREYGMAGLSQLLADSNDLVEDATLEPGQIIRLPILVPARDESAAVVFVKGTVSRNGDPVALDDAVTAGDVIETGPDGFVSIVFSTGSVVNLQPSTRATLTRLNCLDDDDSCLIEIDAATGRVTSDVETRDGQPLEFRINTPYASAAVRGTEFDVSAESRELLVGVTEGAVEVSAMQASVELPAGFGSVNREGQPPGEPIPLLPAPVFRNVPVRLAENDVVQWATISQAEQYVAVLSLDSEGVNAMATFESEDGRLGFADEAATGDYYLSVRAEDENGLLGFRSVSRLTVASIDPAAPTVVTEVTRQANEYLVSIIDPPPDVPGFEIQIATDPEFTDPLSVDVGNAGLAVFRLDAPLVYVRSRSLFDPQTVSAYGPVGESQ